MINDPLRHHEHIFWIQKNREVGNSTYISWGLSWLITIVSWLSVEVLVLFEPGQWHFTGLWHASSHDAVGVESKIN